MVATKVTKEASWFSQLAQDLGMAINAPMLHRDDQSAIALAQKPIFHAKKKHIEVRYHFHVRSVGG